jgi:hypothetical protein
VPLKILNFAIVGAKEVQSASCRFCNHKLRKKIMDKVKGF